MLSRVFAAPALQTLARQALVSKSAPLLRPRAACLTTMKIYTKTGDKGTSSLYSGERRPKNDDVFEALGCVDEANAAIGLAHEFLIASKWKKTASASSFEEGEHPLCPTLREISSVLFDLGAAVATPKQNASDSKLNRTHFDLVHVEVLEKGIDAMYAELPPMKRFVLPMGGLASAQLHFARTLARRAERRVWILIQDGSVDESVGQYLNRLSDYLFAAARYSCMLSGTEDRPYIKASERSTAPEECKKKAGEDGAEA